MSASTSAVVDRGQVDRGLPRHLHVEIALRLPLIVLMHAESQPTSQPEQSHDDGSTRRDQTSGTRQPLPCRLFGVPVRDFFSIISSGILEVDILGIEFIGGAFRVDERTGAYGLGFFGGTIMLCHA